MLPVTHILIVDDDTRIRTLLSKFLVNDGYFVSSAKDAEDAYVMMKKYQFDFLIIDIMMPKESGITLTQNIKKTSQVPILMLTAMSSTEDKINGLSTGVDDYLCKPFEPQELLLRIKNILTRTKDNKPISKLYSFGEFVFDIQTSTLTKNSKPINITFNEGCLLSLLCENIGQIVQREEFVNLLGNINERSVDVQITRLRNKIEPNPKSPIHLKSSRGKGYILYGTKLLN